ncbi:TetR/AcrR family transcriptional regulator [Fictibacillus fluitans]|uniref:TetR/AcrR family transcriptional regulator n=1 Tax=Fictibacillus fluitans TaxID=3058422 RepID=A0ABT8I1E9_9BACL|nr:TetR/AcrR family transcriptional regulator [Fictibacillus sp. NE201]MDN4526804.1 TetR/AcrR family transcriptional regulator [Fictibacillus sp. NE201]
MSSKHTRSEETKKNILKAAGKLFMTHGYESVTIRQIAKEAGCSHTAIYLYYKDKESLLHQLAMPLLQQLSEKMNSITHSNEVDDWAKLKGMCSSFITFCLQHKSMYSTFMTANATRVDEKDPKLQIHNVRIELFQLLRQMLQNALRLSDEKKSLSFARALFYNLHGIISTYIENKEPLEDLTARLSSTFDLSVEAMLLGFREIMKQGVENDEG